MISEGMLDMIYQGKVIVSVDGKPALSLDRNNKYLEIDTSGLEKINLKISNLFEAGTRGGRRFLRSSQLVRKYTKKGWKFSIYDKGDHLLTASGPSRLGPHLSFNPLKLKRILKAI